MNDAETLAAALDVMGRDVDQLEERINQMTAAWLEQADDLKAWARAWMLDGYLKRDAEVLASWVTDDVVHEDPINLGRPVRGRAAFHQMLVETFIAFPNSSFSTNGPLMLSLDGAACVIPWRAFGHFTGPLAIPGTSQSLAPTGRRFDFTGVDVYTFRGGKVATMRSLYDPLEVAEQLSLMPDRQGRLVRLAPIIQTPLAWILRR